MGREIRRVPADWQHPRDEMDDRFYKALYDYDFETEMERWYQEWQLWKRGEHEGQTGEDEPFWEYDCPPDPDTCRPVFTSEPTHYQIYETVSEGTPVSPVFATLDEMVEWLVEEGYSQEAAQRFAEIGFAFSMLMHTSNEGVRTWKDIESLAVEDYE